MSVGESGSFSPSVKIGQDVVTPPGWLWLLGFASAGCEWALLEIAKPEVMVQFKEWMRAKKQAEAEEEIAALERRIEHLKSTIRH